MSYVESNLVPGETVIYQTRLHWIVMLSHLIVGSLLLDLPGVALLIYALGHSEIGGGTLHAMEAAAFLLLFSRVAVILAGMLPRDPPEMAATPPLATLPPRPATPPTLHLPHTTVQ